MAFSDEFSDADWSSLPDEYRFLIPYADRYVKRPLDNDRIVELLDSSSADEIRELTPLARFVSRQDFLDGFNHWFGNHRHRSIAEFKLYHLLIVLDDSVPDSPLYRGHG